MWDALSIWRLFIILAVLVCLDAGVGASNFLAKRVGRPERGDSILLAVVLLFAIGIIFWFHSHVSDQGGGFVDYGNWKDVKAQLLRNRELVERDKLLSVLKLTFLVIEIVSSLSSMLLSFYQRRSLFLWVPLGILGNVGSVVWLLVNRKTGKLFTNDALQ